MSKLGKMLLPLFLLLLAFSAQAIVVKNQPFNSSPGWTKVGTPVDFSNTNNTGGASAAGEAGGAVPCHLTTRVYYADTSLGGSFDLNRDAISASGELAVTGNGGDGQEQGFVGFFNTSTSNFGNMLGFTIVDSGSTVQRIRAFISLNDGSTLLSSSIYINHNTAYTFSIAWNPSTYTETFRLYNGTTVVGTLQITLTPTQVAALGSMNAFGIGNCANNTSYGAGPGTHVDAFIDNVSYTKVSVTPPLGLIRNETFDIDPSTWEHAGNINFTDYDFTRGSSLAGEVGGRIPSYPDARAYYADVNLGGLLNPNTDYLYASGEIAIDGNGGDGLEQGFVGFFDTTSSDFSGMLGFTIVDSSSTRQRIRAYIRYFDSLGDEIVELLGSSLYLYHDSPYTFRMTWDPDTYQLSVELYLGTGSLVGTSSVTVDIENLHYIGLFDAFGIGNCTYNADADEDTYVEAYIDNVSYTAVNNPYSAQNPLPTNGEPGVLLPTVMVLNWASPVTSGSYRYDVYLSTTSTSLQLIASNLINTSYTLSSPSYNTTYYWRVATKNVSGNLLDKGATWRFTTCKTSSTRFHIVALPDTQGYTDSYPDIFDDQTDWIVDNVTPLNIKFVTHLGDMVHHNGGDIQDEEFDYGDASMSVLDGVVPYCVSMGNHDYDERTIPPAKANGVTAFTSHFGPSRYGEDYSSWYKGSYRVLNSYQIFTAGGRQWLHLNLEFEPDDDELLWAQRVIDQHPTLPVILSTHAYLSSSGALGGVSDDFGPDAGNGGSFMWHKFVSHNDQIFMTLNGHYPGSALLISQNDYGHDVFQICVDYQDFENRGNGYLRTLEFDEANSRILAKSYSPYVEDYLTDAANQFILSMNFASRLNSFSSRQTISTVQAANVVVNDSNPSSPILTIPYPQATGNLLLGPEAHERGQYYIHVGDSEEDDSLGGIYIASVTQNGRGDDQCGATPVYHTVSVETGGYGENFVCTSRTSSNTYPTMGFAPSNVNFSVAYFPFSGGWTCGRVRGLDNNLPSWCVIGNTNVHLEGESGFSLYQYPNSESFPYFAPPKPGGGYFNADDPDRGIWTLTIPGVNSYEDGVLLVCGGNSEGNYACASPWDDGSRWTIAVLQNNTTGFTQTDPFNFVYIPYSTSNIAAGRVAGNGSIIRGTNNFDITYVDSGRYRLEIDGRLPEDGALLLSSENEGYTSDNFITYQPINNEYWLIEYRDLPNATYDNGAFTFAFIPFDNPPAAPGGYGQMRAHWRLDECEDINIVPSNLGGGQYGPIYQDMVGFPEASVRNYVTGKVGANGPNPSTDPSDKAYDFSGDVSPMVGIGTNSTNVIPATGNFSLSVTFRASDIYARGHLFSNYNNNQTGNAALYVYNYRVRWMVNGNQLLYSNSGAIAANTWYTVVVTRSGNTWNMYVNGVRQANSPQTNTVTIDTATEWMMGRGTSAYADYDGLISDVRIYNYAIY